MHLYLQYDLSDSIMKLRFGNRIINIRLWTLIMRRTVQLHKFNCNVDIVETSSMLFSHFNQFKIRKSTFRSNQLSWEEIHFKDFQ